MTTTTFDPNKLQTPVTLLYNSTHAASVHEVEFLKTRNREGKLEFVDLAISAASSADYGVSAAAVKELVHARDASGQVFAGIDALFAAHAAIGLDNWFAMCRLPGFLSVGTGIGPRR